MAIALQVKPITTTAKLVAADVESVKNALQPLLQLPPMEPDLENLTFVSMSILPDGTATLNLRFSK
jgi:hypothetical protein